MHDQAVESGALDLEIAPAKTPLIRASDTVLVRVSENHSGDPGSIGAEPKSSGGSKGEPDQSRHLESPMLGGRGFPGGKHAVLPQVARVVETVPAASRNLAETLPAAQGAVGIGNPDRPGVEIVDDDLRGSVQGVVPGIAHCHIEAHFLGGGIDDQIRADELDVNPPAVRDGGINGAEDERPRTRVDRSLESSRSVRVSRGCLVGIRAGEKQGAEQSKGQRGNQGSGAHGAPPFPSSILRQGPCRKSRAGTESREKPDP